MLSLNFNQFRFAQNAILIVFKKNPLLLFDGLLAQMPLERIKNDLISNTAYSLFEQLDWNMQIHLGGYEGLNNILVNYANDENFSLSLSLLVCLMKGICSGINAVDLVVSLEKAAGLENEALSSIEQIMNWNYFSDEISPGLEENFEFALSSLFYTFHMQGNLITDKELEIYKKKDFFFKNLVRQETKEYKLLKAKFIKKLNKYPSLERFAHTNACVNLVALNEKIEEHFKYQRINCAFFYDITERLANLILFQSGLPFMYQTYKTAYEQALEIEKKRFFQLKSLFSGTGIITRSNFLHLLNDTLNYPMPYGMIISSPHHAVNLIKDKKFFFQDPNGIQCTANFYDVNELNTLFDCMSRALLYTGSNDTSENAIAIYMQTYYLNLIPVKFNKLIFDTSIYFLSETEANSDHLDVLKGLFLHTLHYDLLLILQNYNQLIQKYPLTLRSALRETGQWTVANLINDLTTIVYFQDVLSYLFPATGSFIAEDFKEIQLFVSDAILNFANKNAFQKKQKQVFFNSLEQFANSNALEYFDYCNRWNEFITQQGTVLTPPTSCAAALPQTYGKLKTTMRNKVPTCLFFQATKISDQKSENNEITPLKLNF
ncbi:MAG: hypothetical protein REH83_02430 [Rickettsiella sp.]|nr:hypothetical protein [Rickettsiella sp.]